MFSPLVFSKERRLNLMVIQFNIVYKNGTVYTLFPFEVKQAMKSFTTIH